jgi:hypothetical protein
MSLIPLLLRSAIATLRSPVGDGHVAIDFGLVQRKLGLSQGAESSARGGDAAEEQD